MPKNFDPSEMEQKLREAAQKILDAAADALDEAAHEVLADARKLVPTNTGALAASGQVRTDRAAFRADIGFGSGPSAQYATDVHEDMTAAHDDGGAKFFERPLVKARSSLGQRLAAKIEAVT